MSAADFAEIAPVVVKLARSRLRCPDLQSLSLTLAWYYWRQANRPDLPASVWARVGVRHAISGRDLPGIRSHFRDAFDRLDQWQGAGMGDVRDRKPGPLDTAIAREDVERFWEALDEFEKEMCDLLAEGLPNQEVARRMSRTPGAISQRRRRLMERYRGD